MAKGRELARSHPSRERRISAIDAAFIPIGLILVLLPLLGMLVESAVRLFLWAALSFGGVL